MRRATGCLDILDTNGAAALDQDPCRQRDRLYFEVRAALGRTEIGDGSTAAAPVALGQLVEAGIQAVSQPFRPDE